MEIRRFFINDYMDTGCVVRISGDEFIHAVKVLRLKVGYKIVLSNGDGNDYFAEITEIGKDYFTAVVNEVKVNRGAPKHNVTLYQALLKGGKCDFVVQKAVELGISAVKLFVSDNCAEKSVNIDRLNKIALEAAKQCHRSAVTNVEYVGNLDSALCSADCYVTKIAAYEDEDKISLRDALLKNNNSTSVALLIGSEGGFNSNEAQIMRRHGFELVSLGARILRAETAAVATAAITMYELGEMSL